MLRLLCNIHSRPIVVVVVVIVVVVIIIVVVVVNDKVPDL